MTEPGPVSPAAQAVETEPPELWWSPAHRLLAPGPAAFPDRWQVYGRSNWPMLDALPADAVRLVPAPGPDTATAGGERLWRLLDALRHAAGQNAGVGHSAVVAWVELLEAALVERGRAIEACIAAGAGARTDGETP